LSRNEVLEFIRTHSKNTNSLKGELVFTKYS
jgi:hypothetical protein